MKIKEIEANPIIWRFGTKDNINKPPIICTMGPVQFIKCFSNSIYFVLNKCFDQFGFTNANAVDIGSFIDTLNLNNPADKKIKPYSRKSMQNITWDIITILSPRKDSVNRFWVINLLKKSVLI